MATIRLVPSAYTRSSTSRVTVTNDANMYYNTDHTANYCSIRGRNNSSNTYYAFIHGFNFNDVPSTATVSSFSIKIRCYKNSYLQQGTTYRPRLASSPSSSSALSNTTLSSDVTTTAGGTVYTFPNGSLTWNTLKGYGSNFSIEIPLRSSSSSYPYLYVYGAEIEVTYTESTVNVTGVDVSPATATIEAGETTTLTATVSPSNATNKTVTWSTSNSSVATVSNGVVTGVAQGTATITATTQDGSYTDTCAVTVTPAVTYEYSLASSMEVGGKYLIASGNSGTVRLMTNESGGSRQLVGVAATVTNGKISITGSTKSRVEFDCVRYTTGNDVTITVSKNNQYLYSDSATGLRMNAPTTLDRFWHYNGTDHKFWQFKNTSDNGYTDTSGEYKYYLELTNGNFTDNHVTSPSIEDSDIPEIYIFEPYVAASDIIWFKDDSSSELLGHSEYSSSLDGFTDLSFSAQDITIGETLKVTGDVNISGSSTLKTTFDNEFTVPNVGNSQQIVVTNNNFRIKMFVTSYTRQFTVDHASYSASQIRGSYDIYRPGSGGWVAAAKVYKKTNGAWVEQTDLTQVFDSGTNYVKGN